MPSRPPKPPKGPRDAVFERPGSARPFPVRAGIALARPFAGRIEISSEAIAIGRRLQGWLGVPEDRVEWIAGDVLDHPPVGIDFIYLYRPVRPVGQGVRFYEMLARTVARSSRQVTIFSIADCLHEFLPKSFKRFYFDGHLSCFRGP